MGSLMFSQIYTGKIGKPTIVCEITNVLKNWRRQTL
jgi:hypothetical protein